VDGRDNPRIKSGDCHDDVERAAHGPTLSEVVTALAALGKSDLPAQLAQWLDDLDEVGRWALLKLVTGAMRIGVSARLAKTAVAALGDRDADEIEIIWPSLKPPYGDLFAWLEGRAGKPESGDPAPFRPPMLSHAIEEADFAALDPAEFLAEWKWDGIRVQAVAARRQDGHIVKRLFSRTGEDISASFPDLVESFAFEGALDGERLRFFRDHQLPFNHHALVRAPEGDCYVMMNRSLKALLGKLRLPFARVHHIGAPEVFTRHTEKLVVRIAAALRVVAMIVDERMLRGRAPWHSFARPGGKREAAFRSNKLTEEDIDGLYTEAVLLNY